MSKNVDFGFYYTDGKSFLAAPESFPASQYDLSGSGQNWSTLNSTTFRILGITQSNFFTISSAFEIDKAYNEGEDTSGDGVLEELEAGLIIGFQSDNDKDGGVIRGILFVRSITPSSGSSPAQMVMDVKVQ